MHALNYQIYQYPVNQHLTPEMSSYELIKSFSSAYPDAHFDKQKGLEKAVETKSLLLNKYPESIIQLYGFRDKEFDYTYLSLSDPDYPDYQLETYLSNMNIEENDSLMFESKPYSLSFIKAMALDLKFNLVFDINLIDQNLGIKTYLNEADPLSFIKNQYKNNSSSYDIIEIKDWQKVLRTGVEQSFILHTNDPKYSCLVEQFQSSENYVDQLIKDLSSFEKVRTAYCFNFEEQFYQNDVFIVHENCISQISFNGIDRDNLIGKQ